MNKYARQRVTDCGFLPLMRKLVFILSFGLVTTSPESSHLRAQDSSADDSSSVSEEKDWLEFYYENPTPERFVDQMKDWAEDGTLESDHAKPALIAFTSQVLRQNRERIEEWYDALSGLTPEQMQVIHTGMLFSRTTEADDLMRDRFGKAYEEQKEETPKILELPLDRGDTMDMVWGFFYATGSEAAIRRVVTCFRFRDAPEKPPGVNVPEGYKPLYKELPEFALGSLIANASRHPRIIEILKEMYANDKSLLEMEKTGVYEVLSELDPKAFPPKESKGDAV